MHSPLLRFAALTAGLAFPWVAYAQEAVGFPMYLFGDPWFWLFFVLNFVLMIGGGWAIARFLRTWEAAPEHIGPALRVTAWIFLAGYVYQTLHMVEHVAQAYQYTFMGLPASESNGIIWFANLEWNHFLFNAGYEVFLIVAALGTVIALHRSGQDRPLHLFIAPYPGIVQGWHAVEHSVRIVRHLQFSCNPCPGLMDQWFSVPILTLHYWIDFAMVLIPGVTLFWFGFHRVLWRRAAPVAA